jgi:uncharacterized phage protein (TIGR01671 family)
MRPRQKIVSNDEESNMREIKFRAWNDFKRIMFIPNEINLRCNPPQGTVMIEDYEYNWVCDNESKILMQYTGLKDKNGKEIYEGDILNSKNDGKDGNDIWDYSTHDNRIVEWDAEYSCFSGMPDYGENSVYSEEYIEVIGNIYENPEVLKGEYK